MPKAETTEGMFNIAVNPKNGKYSLIPESIVNSEIEEHKEILKKLLEKTHIAGGNCFIIG